MGYGSEVDDKEIVAVKQNRQYYHAHNVLCYYNSTLFRTLQLRFDICNRRLLQRLLSLELELLLSSIL